MRNEERVKKTYLRLIPVLMNKSVAGDFGPVNRFFKSQGLWPYLTVGTTALLLTPYYICITSSFALSREKGTMQI